MILFTGKTKNLAFFFVLCKIIPIFAFKYWQIASVEAAGMTFVEILTSVCCYSEYF